MKRLTILMAVVIVAGVMILSNTKQREMSNTLVLENREALAADDEWNDEKCFGVGSLTCFSDRKVEYIMYLNNLE